MSWFTSTWTEPSASPTGRIGWVVIAPKAWPSRQRKTRQLKTLWKRRSVEKSKNRLFHRAWKSRKGRGIPTFPQRRRRVYEKTQNRTFHLLPKADILTCYEQMRAAWEPHWDPPHKKASRTMARRLS